MRTESHIIYSILEDLKNNQYNVDENITERYLRAMLTSSRADELRIYYNNGLTVSDEVKQMKTLEFTNAKKPKFGIYKYSKPLPKADNEYISDYPKLIHLNGFSASLDLMGIPIPIVGSYEYNLLKKDPFQKKLIFAKTEHQKIYIHVPEESECLKEGDNNILFNHIYDSSNGTGVNRKFKMGLYAVFHDPEDADDYDWEESVWPFPSERLNSFLTNLLRRKFSLTVNAKPDEIQNSRNDSIRYHDNTDINKTS